MMTAMIAWAYLAAEMTARMEGTSPGTESTRAKKFIQAWEVVPFQVRSSEKGISSLGPVWPQVGTDPLCSEDPALITSELNLSGLSQKPFLGVNKFSHT